jgi:hypothetical protein
MTHRMRRSPWPLVLTALALVSCAGGGGGGDGAGSPGGGSTTAATPRSQSDAEIDHIMRRLQPTERFVANADARLLWQATSGYMDRAFPLDEVPVGAAETGAGRQIRTQLVEWVGDGLPHRTRLFVEIRPDAANPANMRLRVTALMIEAEPQLEEAKEGVPLRYSWRLVGSNQRIEETVADHIMKRYLALIEGKPIPIDEELVVPTRKPVLSG